MLSLGHQWDEVMGMYYRSGLFCLGQSYYVALAGLEDQLASPQLLGLTVDLLKLGLPVAGPGEDGRCRAVSELC